MASRCNTDPHVHCLYTPPSAGLFKGVPPQVELTKGQLVSQQTEQGGGSKYSAQLEVPVAVIFFFLTYIFPDNTAASVTVDCASGGTNEYDVTWSYGLSALSHLRNSTGKGLIGFSDAKPVSYS